MSCGLEGIGLGLVSHWPCVTDCSGLSTCGSRPKKGRWAPSLHSSWVKHTFLKGDAKRRTLKMTRHGAAPNRERNLTCTVALLRKVAWTNVVLSVTSRSGQLTVPLFVFRRTCSNVSTRSCRRTLIVWRTAWRSWKARRRRWTIWRQNSLLRSRSWPSRTTKPTNWSKLSALKPTRWRTRCCVCSSAVV